MQQMHMGHVASPVQAHENEKAKQATGQVSSSVNDQTSAAAKDTAEKPAKKEKSKATRMIYLHDTISPEEKMAQLPRYAVERPQFPKETVIDNGPDAAAAGRVRDSDTVFDPAH